jgi:hypothetical protein
MTKPKFKIGDTIQDKDWNEPGLSKIVDITNDAYVLNDGTQIFIEEQDEYDRLLNI